MKHVSLILLSVLLFLVACNRPEKTETVAPIPVSVMTITAGADTTVRHYVGVLEPETRVNLTFSLGGTLTWLGVKNGQYVHRGELIATIDDTRARSMHEAALATLHQAEDAYARMEKVYHEGGISEVRWMQMKTDLAKAQQSEVTSRKSLEDCRMVSPVDGVIEVQQYSVGSSVRAAETFASVQNVEVLNVRYTIPEHEIGRIQVGDRVDVEIPALEQKGGHARITERSLVANMMGHTYTLSARLDKVQGALPGMVAKVNMSSTGSVGAVVPANCVVTVYDGHVVWVVRDSVVSRQHVVLTDLVKNGVLVTDGLENGDVVVIDGYQKLYPGAKVSY